MLFLLFIFWGEFPLPCFVSRSLAGPRCTRAPGPPRRLGTCSLLPGVRAAPASRLTSASESTQAMLNTTLNSIIATQSPRPYSWRTGRRVYLARDRRQSSPNTSAFLCVASFQGNKAAGTRANRAGFMSRTVFLRFPLLSGAFHQRAVSPARTPLLSPESLLSRLGHFRLAAGTSGLHLR